MLNEKERGGRARSPEPAAGEMDAAEETVAIEDMDGIEGKRFNAEAAATAGLRSF